MRLTLQTRHLVNAIGIAIGGLASSSVVAAPPAAPNGAIKPEVETVYRSQIVPFLKKHCVECHGPDAQEGEVRFDQYKDAAAVAADEKTWQRTMQMLRSGAMPPDDS